MYSVLSEPSNQARSAEPATLICCAPGDQGVQVLDGGHHVLGEGPLLHRLVRQHNGVASLFTEADIFFALELIVQTTGSCNTLGPGTKGLDILITLLLQLVQSDHMDRGVEGDDSHLFNSSEDVSFGHQLSRATLSIGKLAEVLCHATPQLEQIRL
jgi:hypothetical protein